MKGKKAGILALLIAVPTILAGALIWVSVWGSMRKQEADTLQENLRSIYKSSWFRLADDVSDMQIALKKLTVASSNVQHILLLDEVWRLSGSAAANLASLPQSHVDTEAANRFIVQAGDYARTLTAEVASGKMLTQEAREQLTAMHEACARLSAELETRIANEDFALESVDAEGYYTQSAAAEAGDGGAGGEETGGASGEESGGAGEAAADGEESGGAATDGAATDGESIADYPTLIYDGPFSDSTEKAEPQGLPEEEIDAAKALENALAFLAGGSLTASGESYGTIETFDFAGTDAAGRAVEVSVARRGGAVLYMMAQPAGGEEGVADEAQERAFTEAAKQYLAARGYTEMEPTYAQYYAGVAVLNFAATQDGVILYPDLIKVYVERQSGTVIGVDAQNYLFSHHDRTLPTPGITEDDARYCISDGLAVEGVRLALIPKTPQTELLCYEFSGKCRGATFIVYINALTGAEEQIFEVIDSDKGRMTV